MNNAQLVQEDIAISLEHTTLQTEALRKKESELVNLIEAIELIQVTDSWSTLKTHIFDSRIESLETQIESESLKETIVDSNLYRLQGRLFEAKKYSLDTLVNQYRVELSHIRKLIQPTER